MPRHITKFTLTYSFSVPMANAKRAHHPEVEFVDKPTRKGRGRPRLVTNTLHSPVPQPPSSSPVPSSLPSSPTKKTSRIASPLKHGAEGGWDDAFEPVGNESPTKKPKHGKVRLHQNLFLSLQPITPFPRHKTTSCVNGWMLGLTFFILSLTWRTHIRMETLPTAHAASRSNCDATPVWVVRCIAVTAA